jgi:hypothetical protein
MGEVSVGGALGAGFSLIRRHPGAIAVWTVVYIVLGLLPQFGFWALMGPAWAQMMASAAGGGSAALNSSILQTQQQASQLQLLTLGLTIVYQTLLLGAAYRAMLLPHDRGFFFLRLTRRELWMGLVLMVLLIGMFVVAFLLMLPLAIIAGILAAITGGGAASAILVLGAVLIAFGVAAWLWLRLSLALPMSFVDSSFRLFESWRATQGQAGRMFLVVLVIFGIALVVEAAIGLVAFFASGGPAVFASFRAAPAQAMARVAPVAIGFALVLAPLATAMFAVVGGAWAQIYRDLIPAPEDAFS